VLSRSPQGGSFRRSASSIVPAIFYSLCSPSPRQPSISAVIPRLFLPCIFRACRFRRLFPLGFLILAFLALLGGILYAPSNFDGLAYRTPRVLNWLSTQFWHWIHTPDERMNARACGFEWMTAPLLLFTGSDRLLFLINWFSFLLLPGLLFSFLKAFYVPARVAWT
jgi:hypothetical protein